MKSRESVKANAKQFARDAESNSAFEVLARAGYVANGIIHALIGIIVLVIASGGRGEGDQAGAMKAVAGAPAGFVVLWLIAIGLWALGVWHAAEGLLARDRSGDTKGAARKWGRRLAEWGQALVFVLLGFISAAVAIGARPDAEQTAEDASRSLLQLPGGPILLALIGVGIGIGGVAFIVMGVLRSFRNRIETPDGKLGRAVVVLGIVGFVAKGVALTIIGVLLMVAAIGDDADTAGGLDGAVDALLDLPLGPALAWIVGVGFLAYAVFTVARARFARM
ncbi:MULTISPECIES: DUF1206 domain-containing protein [Microbacterium]|uniref:DUF1206 domain-containing protein n=1 Tax=Microbacterium TaxID=33882 RepID=UPI000D6424B2|nr:DUF1206 domain-containing protein [Microbacterium sp. KCTC 39802]